MPINPERLKQLLAAYIANDISHAELDELFDAISETAQSEALTELVNEFQEALMLQETDTVNTEAIYERIMGNPDFKRLKKSRVKFVNWWAAAACLLVGLFWLFSRDAETLTPTAPPHGSLAMSLANPITSPTMNHLALRLLDGRMVNLDSLGNGLFTLDDGVRVSLVKDRLTYEYQQGERSTVNNQHMIMVPNGRQFQLRLPDGTQVQLNAFSTMSYSIDSLAPTRSVWLNGEAYFDVSKSADQPFSVIAKRQKITVLGTRFNMSAYDDDGLTKTTLITGRIRVSPATEERPGMVTSSGNGWPEITLDPGQQATISGLNDSIRVRHVDTDESIAWTQNVFAFDNEEISEAMKKISRWYAVDITCADGMSGKRIGGTIPRFERIEELMQSLEETGLLRYKIKKGGGVLIMR